MPFKLAILSISIMLVGFACKKNKESCTILGYSMVDNYRDIGAVISHEYLAAYPGSYWIYSDTSERECTSSEFWTVNKEYDNTNCIQYNNLTKLDLPIITYTGIIYYDALFFHLNDSVPRFHRLIDLDNIWSGEVPNYAPEVYELRNRKITDYYDFFELPNGDVYNDVVRISERRIYPTGLVDLEYLYVYYYAKEIGLIMEEHEANAVMQTPTIERHLTEYYIAPH